MLASLVERIPLPPAYQCAILSGLLLGAGFPPYFLYFLVPLAFTLFPFFEGSNRWELTRLTAVVGFVFYLIHVYWFVSFHAMAFPMVLLVLVIYFGLWGHLLGWAGMNAWTVSGGWILLQFVIGSGVLAFPWSRLATAFAVHPGLVHPVRWTGELVFGGLVVFVGYTLGESIKNRRVSVKFVTSAALSLVLLGGSYYGASSVRLESWNQDFLLVQPNVMSTFDAGDQSGDQLGKLVSLTRRHAEAEDVVVWPETALIRFPLQFTLDGESLRYRNYIHRRRIRGYLQENYHLLAGIRFYDPKPNALDYLNGAVLVRPNGDPTDYYTKRIMVPFGEYIPGMGQYRLIESFGRMVGTLGYRSGQKGGLIELPPEENPIVAGIQICYEDAFPTYVHDQVTKGADLLINISNDSWSRSTAAHWQHFYRARLRAIETGRTVLRNGNTGVTTMIDPLGGVEDRLNPFVEGVLRVRPLKPLGKSYIVKWNSEISLAIAVLLVGVGFWRPGRGD